MESIGPVAFLTQEGSFWAPTPSAARPFAGEVWVPHDDFVSITGLLEAALRRERALLNRLAGLEPQESPEGLWDGWET